MDSEELHDLQWRLYTTWLSDDAEYSLPRLCLLLAPFPFFARRVLYGVGRRPPDQFRTPPEELWNQRSRGLSCPPQFLYGEEESPDLAWERWVRRAETAIRESKLPGVVVRDEYLARLAPFLRWAIDQGADIAPELVELAAPPVLPQYTDTPAGEPEAGKTDSTKPKRPKANKELKPLAAIASWKDVTFKPCEDGNGDKHVSMKVKGEEWHIVSFAQFNMADARSKSCTPAKAWKCFLTIIEGGGRHAWLINRGNDQTKAIFVDHGELTSYEGPDVSVRVRDLCREMNKCLASVFPNAKGNALSTKTGMNHAAIESAFTVWREK